MPRLLARTLVTGFAALAVGTLAACGGESEEAPNPATPSAPNAAGLLDMTEVEQSIGASVREQRGVGATVTCPAEVRQAKDVNFVCLVKTKKFGTTRFAVVQTNDRGDVQYAAEDQ